LKIDEYKKKKEHDKQAERAELVECVIQRNVKSEISRLMGKFYSADLQFQIRQNLVRPWTEET
jgi:hypothetical protein